MAEIEDNKEQSSDWHPAEPEKVSRFKGALGFAKDMGSKAKESAVGAVSRGKEAVQNFDAKTALAKAREQVAHAAERGMETATEMKAIIVEKFEDERLQQLLSAIQEVLTSPEAIQVLESLPFAAGIIKYAEIAKGKTLEQEALTGFGKFKHAIKGTKDLAGDAMGGEIWKTAKIAKVLIESSPDILAKISVALKAKEIKGADTIVALSAFVQDPIQQLLNFLQKN